jgi:hypothetical protein
MGHSREVIGPMLPPPSAQAPQFLSFIIRAVIYGPLDSCGPWPLSYPGRFGRSVHLTLNPAVPSPTTLGLPISYAGYRMSWLFGGARRGSVNGPGGDEAAAAAADAADQLLR